MAKSIICRSKSVDATNCALSGEATLPVCFQHQDGRSSSYVATQCSSASGHQQASSSVKAGVVSSSSTPNNSTPRGAGASHEKRSPTPETIDLSREAKRQYRTAILSQKVKLTSSDILRSVNNESSRLPCMLTLDFRTRPQIVDFLYHRLSSQCKQCGVRFSGTPAGKKEMNDHLDMHFRQNRKADQNIGRGHSRSWFTGIEVSLIYHSSYKTITNIGSVGLDS